MVVSVSPTCWRAFGVERRLYTAGANKARLDPFSPEKPEDVAFVQELLDALHERFKAWVRTRRGERLKGDEAALFDGSFMLGERALEVGLIDGFADVDGLVRELGGEKMRTRVFRPRRRGLLRRLPGMLVDAVFDAVEERSWSSGSRRATAVASPDCANNASPLGDTEPAHLTGLASRLRGRGSRARVAG